MIPRSKIKSLVCFLLHHGSETRSIFDPRSYFGFLFCLVLPRGDDPRSIRYRRIALPLSYGRLNSGAFCQSRTGDLLDVTEMLSQLS